MTNTTTNILQLLKEIEDSGIEGISIPELIAYINVKPFLDECVKHPDKIKKNLKLYNCIILMKRVQGEIVQTTIDEVIIALTDLEKEGSIYINTNDSTVYVRRSKCKK